MFPIFPVDYRFIRLRGTLFIMDTNRQASAKASTTTVSSEANTLRRRGTAAELALCLLVAAFPVTASAQRSATSASKPLPKTSINTAGTATNNPSNEVQKLLTEGQAAHEQGKFEDAIRIYNRVIALSASQPRLAALANFRIGNVLMTQGKFGNAQAAFERALTLNPSDAESYNNLGEALGELKQYQRALEAFNRAISLDQKLIKAKYNQAVSYDRMGNFRYSEFVFRSLIKANPQYSLAYDGLAVTLSKAGRAKEAVAFHERAIALDPREPSYYYNFAISYLMQGNTAKALEQQEKLKALDPAIADRLASVIVKHQM